MGTRPTLVFPYIRRFVPVGHGGVTGSQIPVLEGLETNAGQGSAQFAVSDTGLLVYLEGEGFDAIPRLRGKTDQEFG